MDPQTNSWFRWQRKKMKNSKATTPARSTDQTPANPPAGTQFSRRRFLTTAAKAGAVLALPQIVPGRVLGMNGAVPPNEQIVLGAIGVGNRGTYVLGCFLQEP